MSIDRRELPAERPSTISEEGGRVNLHPASVTGRFRRARSLVQSLLLVFFIVLPWINIDGKPALLLNIASGHFSILGFEFRATDAPLLLFILLGFGLVLALITAMLGRVWCGWACPQTVFIEGVFRRIEVWIEGDHLARKKLDQQSWNLEKILKRGFKWAIFFIAAFIIAHSFMATFIGKDALLSMMQTSPTKNWTPFLASATATGIVLFVFAWFKEQFCLIACPYGRFQSVIMDAHSLVVGYDVKRGEPRRGTTAPEAPTGDCVNCFRCVQVCPTGIDIRRGTQLECIACTACIDACDDVMDRIKKPRGLIRYDSEAGLLGLPTKLFKPQLLIYLGAITVVSIGLFTALKLRESVDIEFHKKRGDTFQRLQNTAASDVRILNTYIVQATNQVSKAQRITLTATDPEVLLKTPYNPLDLGPLEFKHVPIVLDVPLSRFELGKAQVEIVVSWGDPLTSRKETLTVVGPYR